MDRSSFRNIYNVCFCLISFIIKIPKIVEIRECPSVRTAISAHVPVFERSETQYSHGFKFLRHVPVFGYSETQYPHNGRVIYRAPRILINITFMSYYLQDFFINLIFCRTAYISQYNRYNYRKKYS